jgi:hypothetical protein
MPAAADYREYTSIMYCGSLHPETVACLEELEDGKRIR